MLVDYNFNRVFSDNLNKFYAKCVAAREIAYRLWNNFRWRGYIHPDVEYQPPTYKDKTLVKKDLLDQIIHARKKGLDEPGKMKKAKNDFKMNLFKTLSKELFGSITNKYKTDFDLFGYENVRDKYSSMFDASIQNDNKIIA